MEGRSSFTPGTTAVFVCFLVAGCASTAPQDTTGMFQFNPVPIARVGAEELEPVDLREVTDVLAASREELQRANISQEGGDLEASLRHYTAMLELLTEAEVDPSIFYALRTEFDRILTISSREARLHERRHRRGIPEGELDSLDIATGMEIPYPLPERVLIEIEQIQTVYPEAYQRGLDRSVKYIPFIEKELDAAGMPRDLVWLAMVESQFTPKINSRAGAGGMWQFMRSTARRYGLRIDYYIDERYDWQKATRASIHYLRDLYALFGGRWPLAASAYNMGERGMERAIAANGGDRNFWRLIETPPAANRIRRETKKFYPKLLASMIVSKTPERFGFTSPTGKPEEMVAHKVKGAYDLAELNRVTGLVKGTIERLNPELIRGVTPPNSEYTLKVPAHAGQAFLAALEKVPEISLTVAGTHVVRRGETLSQIAKLHGSTVRDLMQLNNIRNPRKLRVGQKLSIGGSKRPAMSAVNAEGRRVYAVRGGDTLSEIAAREKVGVRDIQRWNGMGRSTSIRPGDRLFVSERGVVVAKNSPSTGTSTTHIVRRGESPALIAKRYGVAVDDLLNWNGLTRRSIIREGQKLILRPVQKRPSQEAPAAEKKAPPKKAATATNSRGRPVKHTVAPGENASLIASRYKVRTSDFLKWNGLTKRSVLQIGDEYVVYVPPGASIPAQDSSTTEAGRQKVLHTVRRGQNPTTIARRYGVKVSDLFKWNNWVKTPLLQIGDKIVIYRK